MVNLVHTQDYVTEALGITRWNRKVGQYKCRSIAN